MMNDKPLEKCPFCGSTASIVVDADCDGYRGSIGVFCDNPYCGGAYIGAARTLSGDYDGWIACFPAEDVADVVGGWNRRGSNVARALYENFKETKNEP